VGRGGLDDPLQHRLVAELDRVQAPKLAQRRGDLLRVAGHGRLLGWPQDLGGGIPPVR
jgi:hypothetical protein